MRLLVVEDSPPNVLVITTLLEEKGYVVDVADDGIDAVERAKSGNYTLAFMDVKMAGLNGYEATQAIRHNEAEHKLQRMPIIGVTAYAVAGVKEQCLKAGMDDYMPKPFDSELLIGLVEKFVGKAA